MAEQLSPGVESIRAKCLVLEERWHRLMSERADSQARIEAMETEMARLNAANERLASELRSLRMSAVITPERADRDALRDLLTGLVREIDRCITDLSH